MVNRMKQTAEIYLIFNISKKNCKHIPWKMGKAPGYFVAKMEDVFLNSLDKLNQKTLFNRLNYD
jgi:hypothetical protein